VKKRLQPFGPALDPYTHLVGGVTIDEDGNVYYNVVKVDPLAPRFTEVPGAWLVKITPDDHVHRLSYTTLIPDAPAADSPCYLTFFEEFPRPPLPWPPPNLPDGSPRLPRQTPCLSQRPPLDATPAVAKDGTIFAVTRSHAAPNYSYVVAIRPNLTLDWAASLRDRGLDGCGSPNVSLPCPPWAAPGVDRATNLPVAAQASDASSSAPVALPDGGVAYAASRSTTAAAATCSSSTATARSRARSTSAGTTRRASTATTARTRSWSRTTTTSRGPSS
jgi:hypothetical protein